MALWSGANFKEADFNRRLSPLRRAIIGHITNSRLLNPVLRKIVLKKMVKMLDNFMSATSALPMRKIMANWMFDGKMRKTNISSFGSNLEIAKINIPFVTVQNLGCWNLHQFGSYDLFENAATPADKKWMILAEPTYELPVYSWQLEAVAFFDYILYGADNGYKEQAPVRYWSNGLDSFKPASTFPVPNSKPTRYYLDSGGSDSAIHTLSANTPSRKTNSWVASPHGLPQPGGMEEVVNNVLVYEMIMEKDTEFAGAVTAHLIFSCNEIDSYVITKLSRVDKMGADHMLSMGAISPARRRLDPTLPTSSVEIVVDTQIPQPLIPGESVSLLFSLTPAPAYLRAGEKLRFEVVSQANLVRKDVSQGYCQFDMPTPPYFSRNTLHYGLDSYVELHQVL